MQTKRHLLVPDANDGGTSSVLETPTTETAKADVVVDDGRAALQAKLAELTKETIEPETTTGEKVDEPEDNEVEVVPQEEATESSEKEETPPKDEEEVPFHEHKRWKEKQQEVVELRAKLDAVKPDVDRVKKIDDYCRQYNVTEDQLAEALEMAAVMNNDPVEAFKRIEYYRGALSKYTGDQLPDDLQQQVKDGNLTEEYAKQIVKLRNENELLQRKGKMTAEQHTRTVQQTARQSMEKAVVTWEMGVQARDPDYSKKAKAVLAFLTQRIAERPPRNDAEAVAAAEAAYADANAMVGVFVPKPTNGGSRPGLKTSSAKPAPPRNALEAAQRVVAKYNR